MFFSSGEKSVRPPEFSTKLNFAFRLSLPTTFDEEAGANTRSWVRRSCHKSCGWLLLSSKFGENRFCFSVIFKLQEPGQLKIVCRSYWRIKDWEKLVHIYRWNQIVLNTLSLILFTLDFLLYFTLSFICFPNTVHSSFIHMVFVRHSRCFILI